jgi:hypothetical protein
VDNEEIIKLEEELSQKLKEGTELAKVRLDQNRGVIDEKLSGIVEVYSNDIRNISIISGTIAPFSLTLLSVQQLNSNAIVLIVGFAVLLLNIILAQFFLKKHISEHDVRLIKAEFHWLMADSEFKETIDENSESSTRVLKFMDYLKSMGEAEKLLGISAFNIEIQNVRANLRLYNKITNTLFSLGAFCIVLSVVVNPVYAWLTGHNYQYILAFLLPLAGIFCLRRYLE